MDASFIASWGGNVQWAQPLMAGQFPFCRLYRQLDFPVWRQSAVNPQFDLPPRVDERIGLFSTIA
jgi:hypothetical protein